MTMPSFRLLCSFLLAATAACAAPAAPADLAPKLAQLEKLEIFPPVVSLETKRDFHRLVVLATFKDATTRDVTAFAVSHGVFEAGHGEFELDVACLFGGDVKGELGDVQDEVAFTGAGGAADDTAATFLGEKLVCMTRMTASSSLIKTVTFKSNHVA